MALITLSKEELLYLDDGLTLLTETEEDGIKYRVGRNLAPMAVSVANIDLLLKIGSAIVYLDEEKLGETEIDLYEDELWCIREVSQSSVVYFEKQVGLSLKIKIYRTLLQMYTDHLLADADVPITDISENIPKNLHSMLDIHKLLEED